MGQELHDLLRTALRQPERRPDCVKRFQKAIFDGSQASLGLNKVEWDVLTQLAQDLDYYEPDAILRKEDPSFYGDEQAEAEITEALQKLGDAQVIRSTLLE